MEQKHNKKMLLLRRILFVSILMMQAVTAMCQHNEDIISKLEEKYDDVVYGMMDSVFCVKQNGEWEFADAQGNILTSMHIASAKSTWNAIIITVEGQEYKVESPIINGRLLVGRYERYAYMDKKGKLISKFIYNYYGNEEYTASESDEAIRVNDAAEKFLSEAIYALAPSADKLLQVLSPTNAHLIIDDYDDKVTTYLVRYALSKPAPAEKSKLEAIFEKKYSQENCGFTVAKVIAIYRYQTAENDKDKFLVIQDMTQRYNDAECYTLYADMLRQGLGCQQDVQKAIYNYSLAAVEDSRDAYAENARQALRDLWLSDSTRYDNKYGKLLTHYDDFRILHGYVFVRNGELTGICDSTFNEVLPCRYKNLKTIMEPLFGVETADGGIQLVKTGGHELTEDIYDDIKLVQYQDGTIIVFVEKDNLWGILNDEGKTVSPMVFDYVSMPYFSFGDTYPTITKGDVQFELYTPFKGQRAIIRQNNLYGIIDAEGNIIAPCQYKSIDGLKNGSTTIKAIKEETVDIDLTTGKELKE